MRRHMAMAFTAMLLSSIASIAVGAAKEEPGKGADAKGGDKGESVQLDSIPRAGNPGVDALLDAAREKLVKKTKRENERRDALKEEAERQKKIRKSLQDAGVDLEYLPEPEAMRQVREMTSPEAREEAEPDLRPEQLYSKIEAGARSGSGGLQAELSDDQKQIILRVLCNEKGSEPDARTLSELKLSADEAQALRNEFCD